MTENGAKTNGMRVEQVMVTPKMAGDWLTKNTQNRHESPKRIRRYANDMTGERWMLTHQPIAFDTNDQLLDGQNRLLAVQRANMTIPFLVAWDCDPRTFYLVDQGKPRSLADALTIKGEINARNIAAFTNLLWRTTEGKDDQGFAAASTPGTARALEFWEPQKEGLRAAVKPAHHVHYYLHGPHSAYGAMYHRFVDLEAEDADTFYARLAMGTNLSNGNPILTLRNHILQSLAKAEHKLSLDRLYVAAVMVKSWNAWRNGKSLKTLTYKAGGTSPEPFPEPQ